MGNYDLYNISIICFGQIRRNTLLWKWKLCPVLEMQCSTLNFLMYNKNRKIRDHTNVRNCGTGTLSTITDVCVVFISSSSSARQPYVGPGLPQKLLPAEVSGCCFFRFRDKSLLQGGVVSTTPNLRLSWRAYVFCQGCLP
jgi:hypothetical protein